MPLSTKTQDEIFNAMKADLASRVPLLDLDRPGVARALLQVFAAALRMLHVAVEEIYDNLFPDTADRVTLSRWYEVFGLTWSNDTSTEDARRQVLFLFRDAVPGSAAFYEQYILTHFEEVDRVEVRPRLRGAGTVDIVVGTHA
ncbi:MAG: YmfQ family protein, partial [Candidatus Hydrothermae bacterium]|nr:YmfQ family protein [Candidatus Hydrothermae bacterium]